MEDYQKEDKHSHETREYEISLIKNVLELMVSATNNQYWPQVFNDNCFFLTLDLLNQDLSFFENTVDPDQLASKEAP